MRQETQEVSDKHEDVAGCPVLIVSTDREFVSHYRGMLVPLGIQPITATTSEAALAVLRLTVVAFVVVDQEIGTFDTRRILQRARKTQLHAPILVITRQPDPYLRREALALGAAAYLNHPVLRDDIVYALVKSKPLGR